MISKFFGLVGLAGCLAAVYIFESHSNATGFMRILHWPAMVLTGLGPCALVLLCVEWTVVWKTLKLLLGTSAAKRFRWQEREKIMLYRLGREFYAEGPSAFEKINPKGVSKAVERVIERLAIRMPVPDIRDMVQKERDLNHMRIQQSASVIGLGLRLSPSLGMLGTILGMVRLLESLQDPSEIGPHMSLALLTTFFGLFFSLVFWTPLQQKIDRVLDVECERFDQVVRWLELLERRKPADYFSESVGMPSAPTEKKAV